MNIKFPKLLLVFLTSYFVCSYYAKTHPKEYLHNTPIISKPIPEIPKTKPTPPAPPKIIDPKFINIPIIKNRINEKSIYADIMNHASVVIIGYDRATNAHETTHQINAQIRKGNQNAFYVCEDRAFVTIEPNIRKNQVAEFIPNSLKFFRYDLYVTGQSAWDKQPLYLIDEWVSYTNGSEVNVEDVKTNKHDTGWTDGVSGSLEFSIYCTALAMAIEKYDPSYWESENGAELKRFIYWHLKKSEKVFNEGYKLKEFIWDKQEDLLNKLKTSPDAETMRNFIQTHFEGVWLKP